MILENVLVSEAEEKIFENEDLFEQFEIKTNTEDSIIYVDQPYVHIKELGVNVHNASYCTYDENKEEYNMDFSLYVFLNLETEEVWYDEGGSSLEVAIFNYSGFSMEYIRNKLKCDVYV